MRSQVFDFFGSQNLTPKSPGFDSYPSFSGDGKEIVFVSARGGSLDLYLMNAYGSNVRRLTDDHATNLFPSFSPASNQIAFVSNRDNPKSDIFDVYLLDLDANGAPGKIRRITHDEGQHGHTMRIGPRKFDLLGEIFSYALKEVGDDWYLVSKSDRQDALITLGSQCLNVLREPTSMAAGVGGVCPEPPYLEQESKGRVDRLIEGRRNFVTSLFRLV
jgi:dipeptidyl aminopeptidase/acylaminoacyl peptidase